MAGVDYPNKNWSWCDQLRAALRLTKDKDGNGKIKMNFKSPDWVQNAVFYQIFPDRFHNGNSDNDPENVCRWGDKPTRDNFFGGDLAGIIRKLPYLEELGVNALYLNPIFKSPSNHKYDTTDYYKVDSSFGDRDTLKKLVKKLHQHGMRIILDGVFNHCGDTFWAFQDVIEKGSKSKYKNWFIIKDYPIVKQPEPNYRCLAGFSSMPEFNTDNPKVREYLLKVVKYWIKEADIDGWRLDTVEYMDASFVKQIRIAAKEVKEDAYVMGEVMMGLATSWFKGECLDAVMNYRLRHLLIDFLVKRTMDAEEFDQRLYSLRQSYPDWANPVMFNLLGSHDTPRIFTLCKGNKGRFKLCLIFSMTYVGAPTIYYGDEVGLRGGNDPECRKCMPWNIDFQSNDIYKFHQRCIQIRKQYSVLRKGSFQTLLKEKGIYSFVRKKEEETIIVIMNSTLNSEEICINLSEKGIKGNQFLDLLTGQKYFPQRGKMRILLPKTSGVILANNYVL